MVAPLPSRRLWRLGGFGNLLRRADFLVFVADDGSERPQTVFHRDERFVEQAALHQGQQMRQHRLHRRADVLQVDLRGRPDPIAGVFCPPKALAAAIMSSARMMS